VLVSIVTDMVKRRGWLLAAIAVAVLGFWYALSPRPVPVDLHTIGRGDLRITIDEEGKTRIKDIFVVSAPATGRVLRSQLEPGDAVTAGKTTVAAIEPSPPPFMDLRQQRELKAQIEAARAAVDLADAEARKARSELEFARQDLARAEPLAQKKVVSERTLEKARIDVATGEALLAKAEASKLLRQRELETAIARLTGPDDLRLEQHSGGCCVAVQAPVSGRVLSILQKSEKTVAEGTPLLSIGDPANLEVVVELLSADAVRVPDNARALITSWGGPDLAGQVNRIEPAAFTKVSALGIEEQRVLAILDFDASVPDEVMRKLGHDFRVFTRIIIDEIKDVVVVPLGALFRQGAEWAVYVDDGGSAKLTTVELGERNSLHAAVESGLEPGTRVILHPSDRVTDGAGIEQRKAMQ